ncbi:MAG: RagB/SusD family nutrient uptake outer membrane protein [Salinibacter sp.]|uniref:RagB/SusD family nutrient uptake outer membrane protein n=1 Tax=Salinibacter sp. TaxID=2065818 RepID=UPI002FC32AD5
MHTKETESSMLQMSPMRLLTRTLCIAFACSLLIVGGCDNPVTVKPRDELPSENVWQDAGLTKAFLNRIYANTGSGFGSPTTASLVDMSHFTHGWSSQPVMQSTITPTDQGSFSDSGFPSLTRFNWENVFSQLRKVNIFLKNVQASDALPSSEKGTLLAEARFLRGYFYHNLLRTYGGVPVIKKVFSLEENPENFQVPRNSFKETVDFIVSDLNTAASNLSIEGRRPGAASKGAAHALKCRVLLYAASDLYNQNPSGMEVTGYTGGSQQDRWEKAKSACQSTIDLGAYSLAQASTPGEYHDLFATKETHSGVIWARFYDPSAGGAHNMSLWQSPNGYLSWTGDAPLQQHINSYEMADGSEFEWQGGDPVSAEEPIDVENPYKNRDPRFYANILYNGAEWRPRPSGPANIDPKGIYQPGEYEMPNQENLRPGLDSRRGPFQDWNGSHTGYNAVKFVEDSILPHTDQAFNPWPFIRYAEVLLNYAEAAAELEDTDDAVRALNKVRSRVGMPDVPADGGPNRTLLERVRQERQVELAFEQHRFFDVRRWMIAPQAYEDGHGVNIVGRLDENGEKLVKYQYNFLYNVIDIDNRRWRKKAYFLPIPRAEMERNPNLVQNPNY